MTAADLYEPGFENRWEFKADGKRIVGTGTMELMGVNRLIGLLSPINVGDADYEAWRSSYQGQAAGSTSGSTAAVPEPSTMPLVIAACGTATATRGVYRPRCRRFFRRCAN